MPATMVVPERDIPGKRAKVCAIPIINALFISGASSFPSLFLTENSIKPVMGRVIATIFNDVKDSSMKF